MKRLIITTSLAFIALSLNAQFSERNIAEKSSANLTYDTSHNFQHHKKLSDYKLYIGQEFYILPLNYKAYVSEDDLKRFKNLKYKTPRLFYKNDDFKKKNKKNISYRIYYKGDITDTYTPYDSVAGKIFKVIDFDETKSKIITEGYNQLHFTLLEEKTNDTIVWTPEIYYFNYPYSIAIVSYLNKIKANHVGAELIARANMTGTSEKPYSPPYHGHLINLNTGEAVIINELESLVCTDLSVIGIYSSGFKQPMLVLKNSKGDEFGIFIIEEGRKSSRPSLGEDFILKTDYLNICKEFGEENGTLITLHKVKIGMTNLMCLLSWGEPKKINKTIGEYGVHEQWIYESNSFLYFENDILTTIQTE